MTPHRNIRLSVIIGLICCLAVTAQPAQEKEYRIMIPISNIFGDDTFKSMFSPMVKAIFDTSGLLLKMQEYRYAAGAEGADFPSRKILDLMNKGQMDFGMVFSQDYLRYLMKQPSNALPILTITFYGKPTSH